ncbi:MAG: tRNA dihydrouridine(20/20a) synthase DusA, partial [Thiomonas sp.]
RGLHPQSITRHMLNLWKGEPGGRLWRQVLSDSNLLSTLSVTELFKRARDARLSATCDADPFGDQQLLDSACA